MNWDRLKKLLPELNSNQDIDLANEIIKEVNDTIPNDQYKYSYYNHLIPKHMKTRKLTTKDVLPEPKATDDFIFLDNNGTPIIFMRMDLIVKMLNDLNVEIYDKS